MIVCDTWAQTCPGPRDPLLPAVHSLLPPTPRIRLSVFSETCALFHFLDHSYPASFPQVAPSPAKNRGYTPARSYHASSFVGEGLARRSFSGGGLSPSFPLHTNTSLVCLLFPLLTQKQGGVPPRKNVG